MSGGALRGRRRFLVSQPPDRDEEALATEVTGRASPVESIPLGGVHRRSFLCWVGQSAAMAGMFSFDHFVMVTQRRGDVAR
jgi:hypothetical protein